MAIALLVGKHLFISGRVQGVFFRRFTQQLAKKLALTGWVKNLADSRVEVKVFGSSELVQQLITNLWTGNPAATVTDIFVEDILPESHTDFIVLDIME